MDKHLDVSHLPSGVQTLVTALVKKYWCVFDEKGLYVPVKDYECVIDTGNHRPIAVTKINYGPQESIIMRKCIAALLKLGHIHQVYDGPWLFKALLAAKPHQEHVTKIEDFVWRFCVNYIPLNMITSLIAYPIPRCDAAVAFAFGKGKFFWLFDAPQGYHQLRVSKSSQAKLAFAGPDATKYTYSVMPFGPTNGPAIFIIFMFDTASTTKTIAAEMGVSIDSDTNTNIIIDDNFSWAKDLNSALLFMEAQFRVYRSQNLSLSLKKCHFFPKRVEFVGTDVSLDGNHPAMSKHQLLTAWPKPKIVRDISSFIGFINYYCAFIPHMELRIRGLRELTKLDLTESLDKHWTTVHEAEMADMKTAILDDPCLKRYDHTKRLYLRTDFSSHGMGYAACQPGDDEPSILAMQREMAGSDCEFMRPNSLLVLHPVAFASRKNRGYELKLHSHLGEGFAGDWAMNRCRHFVLGQRFTWFTDCYAIKFILSYDGPSPVLLRLQMRLSCWDMDIVHRPGELMGDADYWSRLGVDLQYDPLLRDYINRVLSFKKDFPAPTELPMLPENMPGFRGPRFPSLVVETPDKAAHATVSTIFVHDSNGHTFIENVPVRFGNFSFATDDSTLPTADPRQLLQNGHFSHVTEDSHLCLLNNDLPTAARLMSTFDWAVYGFNNGHFLSTWQRRNLPFHVALCADPHSQGRALFKEFSDCNTIVSGLKQLLDHVRSSPSTARLHGYLIHSPRFLTSTSTIGFWRMQASVVTQMLSTRSLSTFVAFMHPDNDSAGVDDFIRILKREGWRISSNQIYFPDYGDSIASYTFVVFGVHKSSDTVVEPIALRPPPQITPAPLASFLWRPFNSREMAVSFARDDILFDREPLRVCVSNPIPLPGPVTYQHKAECLYYLHRLTDDAALAAGSGVYSVDHLCPPFYASDSTNLFTNYFGIEFPDDGNRLVRPISPFEFTSCFNLLDAFTYRLSQPEFKMYGDAGIPSSTSSWVFDAVHTRLLAIRDANCQIFDPSSHAAPAAMCNVFLSGAIGTRLPDAAGWKRAYASDPECVTICSMIKNPSLISKVLLQEVHYNLRNALRRSRFSLERDMIILKEPLQGSESYVKLRFVPHSLRNLVFIAFHANPIGGHFNPARTYSRIRLRYFWPGMFKYCESMCRKCPACALANPTARRSSELVYSFPVEAPFLVLHADLYQAGNHASFEGNTHYLIVCCGMTTFSAMEPVSKPDSTACASALMKITLKYGLCHTLVLDKDKKFYSVFREVVDLLQLNCHTLSGENHDGMLIERVNRYLNRGLSVMTNERESVRVAQESILLLLYAWNSAPIPGTDLSRSLIAIGREFSFPIDFSAAKHYELTSSPATVQSYAKDLATLMSTSLDIVKVLVDEHRSYHREKLISSRPDPRIFAIGDIVFARRAVRSDAKRGRVDKLMYAHTGPWRIVEKLDGSSYKIAHCLRKDVFEKKHAAYLSPYPLELVPFAPVDGQDNRFGQLHKPISKQPFVDAGISGFKPIQPYQLPALYASATKKSNRFYWPSLAELNEEVQPFPWLPGEEDQALEPTPPFTSEPVFYTGPPPALPTVPPICAVPPLSTLIASIVSSIDKLFFISWQIPGSSIREWRLIRINFKDTMRLYPAALQDGKFLAEFYIVHTDDVRFNGINQRYWLQYHSLTDIATPSANSQCHLVKPSPTAAAYASRNHLVPFRQYINITHTSTFIHGPFDFAHVAGRKTRDRISLEDWKPLCSYKPTNINPTPRLDLPSFSVHVDRSIHTTISSPPIVACLMASAAAPDAFTIPLY